MPEENKQRDPLKKNQSVEKVFRMVEAMSVFREPVRLQDLAERLGYPASTVLRFLRTLRKLGYAEQDPETQKYYLTLKICRIAGRVRDSNPMAGIARPVMKALSEECGESVCLAVERDDCAVYVEVVDGPDKILRSLQRIGNRSPLHCTGVGKLFLLNRTPQELADFFERESPLQRLTSNTITNPDRLRQALERIRKQGYAFDDEECELGAKCVAFPVRDYTGRIVAGLSVTGTVFHLNEEFLRRYAPRIRAAADRLSVLLGYAAGG